MLSHVISCYLIQNQICSQPEKSIEPLGETRKAAPRAKEHQIRTDHNRSFSTRIGKEPFFPATHPFVIGGKKPMGNLPPSSIQVVPDIEALPGYREI